jgi:hypothetical protein
MRDAEQLLSANVNVRVELPPGLTEAALTGSFYAGLLVGVVACLVLRALVLSYREGR